MEVGPICNHASPHSPFSGLSLTYSWGSAAAKAYPSNMCRMLAATFLSHFRSRFPELCSPLDRGFPTGLPPGSFHDPPPS
eukprot:2197281-Pyramimonas_sp.AAC.1